MSIAIGSLALSGCTGQIIIPADACVLVECGDGLTCVNGECVPPCNPGAPNGLCEGDGSLCVFGVCYGPDEIPAPCGAGVNGTCPDDGACVSGFCQAIGAGQACDPANPTGLCPGGSRCVQGVCFPDEAIDCGPTTPEGTCPDGQTCDGAACVTTPVTCADVDFDGDCSAWQDCVQGSCVGPIPTDACGPSNFEGRCPVGERCVRGTCTPLNVGDNTCAFDNPQGLCPAPALCQGGTCVLPRDSIACSTEVPAGLCPPGEVCDGAACVPGFCGGGGLTCDPGTQCQGSSTCQALPCSPTNPSGVCTDTTLACDRGVCVPPTCGAGVPDGVCPVPFICQGEMCVEPVCSMTFPSGICPPTQTCVSGTCVEDPCAPTNTDGLCLPPDDVRLTADPVLGFAQVAAICCDASLESGLGCTLGTCTASECSVANPRGQCPINEFCNAGTCEPATCSPFFLNGSCPAGESCIFGSCAVIGCSADPGLCDPGFTCNLMLDACEPEVCGVGAPDGLCPVGQVCGTGMSGPECGIPECAPEFPGGRCLANEDSIACPSGACEVCAGGMCIVPPCSPAFVDGNCGPNFECNAGVCELSACSPTALLGFCTTPGEECAADGVCRPFECSAFFPNAPCPTPGQVCNDMTFMCEDALCTMATPGGVCSMGEVCAAGMCTALPCGQANPTGECPANFTCCDSGLVSSRGCNLGTCVELPCGAGMDESPTGFCDDECRQDIDGGGCTCDEGSADFCVRTVCDGTACVPFECGETLPPPFPQPVAPPDVTDLPCLGLDDDKVCIGGTCVDPPCSAPFPAGVCAGMDEQCINGSCEVLCSDTAKLGWCPAPSLCVEGSCSAPCAGDIDCDGISDTDETHATCALQMMEGDCNAVSDCSWGSPCCTWDATTTSCVTDRDQDGAPDWADRDADDDGLPDEVELGAGPSPASTDGDGVADFRDLDSDDDHISDNFEVGPAPFAAIDTDGDGTPDWLDSDSDDDGIPDACEVSDIGGLCGATGIVAAGNVLNSDGDSLPDYRDLDSDDDGIADCVEATPRDDLPTVDGNGNGTPDCREMGGSPHPNADGDIDADGDGTADYRDLDSDGDGAPDADEDVNGDGIVNCQVDGTNAPVPEPRDPACDATITHPGGNYTYNYNEGCNDTGTKCLLAETSRTHPDSDGDTIDDDVDGIFLVCGANNLKPVNVAYSLDADYALALEQEYDTSRTLTRSGEEAGELLDDTAINQFATGVPDGSYAVAGFILSRVPDAAVQALTPSDPSRELIEKALAHADRDEDDYATVSGSPQVELVLNRSFETFDGYGAVVSRYRLRFAASQALSGLRDDLVEALDGTLDAITPVAKPTPVSSDDYTLLTHTLYRYGTSDPDQVLVVGALVPTGSGPDDPRTYNYRARCSLETVEMDCNMREGCLYNTTDMACEERDGYQVPLFFADNLGSGSAVAQWGDDLEALCQSLIQENSLLDFVWLVDDSNSMDDEIDQVLTSSQLFFGILDNSEADYRVAQTTSFTDDATNWEPQLDPSDGTPLQNGVFTGVFTGARAGDTTGLGSDRAFTYTCTADPSTRCATNVCGDSTEECCPACVTNGPGDIDDPSCYFASRLPCTDPLRGDEHSLIMAQWALYRAGADTPCVDALDQTACEGTSGCTWNAAVGCYASYCDAANDPNVLVTVDQCTGSSLLGGDALEDELEPASCDVDIPNNLCLPAVGIQCAGLNETDCNAEFQRCEWVNPPGNCVPSVTLGTVLCKAVDMTSCQAQPGCVWDTTDALNPFCRPPEQEAFRADAEKVVVILSDEDDCYVKDDDFDGECSSQWAGDSVLDYDNAVRVARTQAFQGFFRARDVSVFAMTGDKADVSGDPEVITGNPAPNGGCFRFDDCNDVRTGDSAPPDRARCRTPDPGDPEGCVWDIVPASENHDYCDGFTVGTCPVGIGECVVIDGRCTGGRCYRNIAEAGNAHIDVAENTGGGWGSICAADLFPTIEGIVIASLGKASPYVLEGFIDGESVQPIAATLQVAVEVCQNPADYPDCLPAAREMRVVSRSRDDGFDYDAIRNTLLLYGDARPATDGDIVVSYQYWVDKNPPGIDDTCPCPETDGACLCPNGTTCGLSGTLTGGECTGPGCTDECIGLATEMACDAAGGCTWSTINGGQCLANGLCELDPTCGGCTADEICDPSTGLCVCDTTCANKSGCGDAEVCISAPGAGCGTCTCDTTCGGGCGAGEECIQSGPNCGQCGCDTDCSGQCTGQGVVCDTNSGCAAIMDQGTCDGTAGCSYDTDLSQCLSDSCGFCVADPTCGGPCEPDCSAGTDRTTCEGLAVDCRWAPWENSGAGGCVPQFLASCDPISGRCAPDCDGRCGPGESCDSATGECSCDTACGAGCGVQDCDVDPLSATCGLCVCDTTCGGVTCPAGTTCDTNAACAGAMNEGSCTAISGCGWDSQLLSCVSVTCGVCVVDPTCGGCGMNEVCNPTTGLCEPNAQTVPWAKSATRSP